MPRGSGRVLEGWGEADTRGAECSGETTSREAGPLCCEHRLQTTGSSRGHSPTGVAEADPGRAPGQPPPETDLTWPVCQPHPRE